MPIDTCGLHKDFVIDGSWVNTIYFTFCRRVPSEPVFGWGFRAFYIALIDLSIIFGSTESVSSTPLIP